MSLYIIILRLFNEIKSIEFQSPGNFLFALENSQWDFQIVIGNAHENRYDGMSDTKDSDDILQIVIFFVNMYVFVRFIVFTYNYILNFKFFFS